MRILTRVRLPCARAGPAQSRHNSEEQLPISFSLGYTRWSRVHPIEPFTQNVTDQPNSLPTEKSVCAPPKEVFTWKR
ncbi:hypothetical protein EVAR_103188_1 [Eumeta japonica]|uniref:Uncharacterized protein n=1 Tax=Eumeta variegata TaxID=151549 RepID=A0A4C1YCB7_EUMVA|nr:hypothetical protein EVAR_103188_1 [Eumeta japonica]